MKRIGRHIVTGVVALDVPWARTRLDPNGYYAVLGLDKNRPHLMSAIRSAYLRRIREIHPDVCEDYDEEDFLRVQLAYRVLSDPVMRKRYDALGPGEAFLDEFTDRRFVSPAVAVEKSRVEEDYPSGPWAPVVYLYDDVLEVSPDIVTEWVYRFVVVWSEVMPGEIIRVGFGRYGRLDRRPWGFVTVVPVSVEPSFALASLLVTEAVKEVRQNRAGRLASAGAMV